MVKPAKDIQTIRKALLLRRPDDAEYTNAAIRALGALDRLEALDLLGRRRKEAERASRQVDFWEPDGADGF